MTKLARPIYVLMCDFPTCGGGRLRCDGRGLDDLVTCLEL